VQPRPAFPARRGSNRELLKRIGRFSEVTPLVAERSSQTAEANPPASGPIWPRQFASFASPAEDETTNSAESNRCGVQVGCWCSTTSRASVNLSRVSWPTAAPKPRQPGCCSDYHGSPQHSGMVQPRNLDSAPDGILLTHTMLTAAMFAKLPCGQRPKGGDNDRLRPLGSVPYVVRPGELNRAVRDH
jgi:hypothetical protein